mmetsp:Transcript_20112/g.50616  ORF Transcript_20112/g.50616 Transcript_20112/m.50616 type:complete len:301 (+) Transcript_20112:119-1021(+)
MLDISLEHGVDGRGGIGLRRGGAGSSGRRRVARQASPQGLSPHCGGWPGRIAHQQEVGPHQREVQQQLGVHRDGRNRQDACQNQHDDGWRVVAPDHRPDGAQPHVGARHAYGHVHQQPSRGKVAYKAELQRCRTGGEGDHEAGGRGAHQGVLPQVEQQRGQDHAACESRDLACHPGRHNDGAQVPTQLRPPARGNRSHRGLVPRMTSLPAPHEHVHLHHHHQREQQRQWDLHNVQRPPGARELLRVVKQKEQEQIDQPHKPKLQQDDVNGEAVLQWRHLCAVFAFISGAVAFGVGPHLCA